MNGSAHPTSGTGWQRRAACYDALAMTTKLGGVLKREVVVDGDPYTVTITSEGLKLVPKGRRKGYELEWASLVSGEAALAAALNASLAKAPDLPGRQPGKSPPVAKKRTKSARGSRS